MMCYTEFVSIDIEYNVTIARGHIALSVLKQFIVQPDHIYSLKE